MLTLTGVTACFIFAGPAAAAGCELYASPSGSDSANGSASAPVATVAALDQRLKPGETGCLQSGTYGSISTDTRLNTSGAAGAQITITPTPGQAAKLVGLVQIEGSYTTLQGLTIDGSNATYVQERPGTSCPFPVSNGLEIDGQDDVFQDNDFSESVASLRGNGIGVGWNSPANNAIIRDNRIHDVGQCDAFDHLIYLAHGSGVQIYDNWMWNDPHGWGVQIYPAASGADIYNNVIDGAGSGFVVGGGSRVSNNTIEHNIVINSTGLPDGGPPEGVAVSTCCGTGTNNTFADNVSYNNRGGIGVAVGVTLTDNSTADPDLANPVAHDYRPTAGPLTTWGLWDGGLGLYGAAPASVTPPPTAAAPSPPAAAPTDVSASNPKPKKHAKQHGKHRRHKSHKKRRSNHRAQHRHHRRHKRRQHRDG